MNAARCEPIALAQADRDTRLNAIADAGAYAAGRVVTLDFTAIKTRIGPRWSARGDDVRTRIEQYVAEHVGRSGAFFSIGDVQWLICFADHSGFAAQALGFSIMEDALSHFLGSYSPEDLRVSTATVTPKGEVVITPIAQHPQTRAEPRQADRRAAECGLAKMIALPACVGEVRKPFVLHRSLDRVVNIRAGSRVGLRISARIEHQNDGRRLDALQQAALPTRTMLAADLNVLEMLKIVLSQSRGEPVVIAPLFFPTLGVSHSRLAVCDLLQELSAEDRKRLIIELVGLEPGIPPSRIVEAQTILKSFCRFTLTRTVPQKSAAAILSEARPPALGVSAFDFPDGSAQLAAGLLAFGVAARSVSPLRLAADLQQESLLSICDLAGFTHASVRTDWRPKSPGASDQHQSET